MSETQTARRIWILISESLMDSDGGAVEKMTKTIAAEIDGLRDELAVILRERNDAHLALAAARAHNAELSTELAGANFEGNLAMIQRDEARAEVERQNGTIESEAWQMAQMGRTVKHE
jgi:hypothetical protein